MIEGPTTYLRGPFTEAQLRQWFALEVAWMERYLEKHALASLPPELDARVAARWHELYDSSEGETT